MIYVSESYSIDVCPRWRYLSSRIQFGTVIAIKGLDSF